MNERLKVYFLNQNIDLSDTQIDQFLIYYKMMVEKNKVMNLTTVTEFDEVLEKHFADSISLNRVVNLSQKLSVMDMGTGAGFPGIPLKITYPSLNITLADSLNKRIKFLDEVIESLKLNDMETIHGRAEDIAHNIRYREKYDICVSRAVANLAVLTEYCLPFVRTGGKFVAYKSDQVEDELSLAEKAIQILGGRVSRIEKFYIGENARSLVVIDKIRQTPKKYPRKAGIPSKEPL